MDKISLPLGSMLRHFAADASVFGRPYRVGAPGWERRLCYDAARKSTMGIINGNRDANPVPRGPRSSEHEPMRLHVVAPTRIDLAGGTLDIWPLYLLHPGALTLNLALSRYAHARLETRRDARIVLVSRATGRRAAFSSLAALAQAHNPRLPLLAHLVRHFAPRTGLTLTTWSEVPAGAGLGGSSALAVAIAHGLACLTGRRLRRQRLIALVRDLEVRVLQVPTGEQDFYAAAYGGLSAIHLDPGGTWREPLRANLQALQARLVLAYTGKPRHSGINNWEVTKARLEGRRVVVRNLDALAEISVALRAALRANDWRQVGKLIDAEWRVRRRNAPTISTPAIDRLVRMARRAGARAGKVCGAGGGGCVVFYSPPENHTRVAQALMAAGAAVLPFRIAPRGVRLLRQR
ncbi:MAG: GHMP kinase [Terriglobia bacterium]